MARRWAKKNRLRMWERRTGRKSKRKRRCKVREKTDSSRGCLVTMMTMNKIKVSKVMTKRSLKMKMRTKMARTAAKVLADTSELNNRIRCNLLKDQEVVQANSRRCSTINSLRNR